MARRRFLQLALWPGTAQLVSLDERDADCHSCLGQWWCKRQAREFGQWLIRDHHLAESSCLNLRLLSVSPIDASGVWKQHEKRGAKRVLQIFRGGEPQTPQPT